MSNRIPPILMIIGGLILAISPWIDQVPNLDPIIPPSVDGAWVVVIEETSERSPVVARVAGDGEFWRGLESRGVKWRFYDVDSPDAKSYREPAEQAGIPAVLVLDSQGKLLVSKPLPATTDGINELVRGSTGK